MSRTEAFSHYEITRQSLKFMGESTWHSMDCVGTVEQEMEIKKIEKKCRGVVKKTRTKGTGSGTLKITVHIPYQIYVNAFGMVEQASGVFAYGENSRHKEFTLVQECKDEDGNILYICYPRCIISTGVTNKTENGAEEVAEIEAEIAVMPDDFGNGYYEAVANDISSTIANQWMTNWTHELISSADNSFTITPTLTNCRFVNDVVKVASGDSYYNIVVADDGYELPNTITVGSLTAGTDYLYNSATGSLFVKSVSANLTITITATEEA